VRWYCRYHIIIVPKYRKKVIFGTLRKEIGGILRQLCDQEGVVLRGALVQGRDWGLSQGQGV
jgi:putative transposase